MNVMLSKAFFPQHPKAGEPTDFATKVKNGTKRHTCRCNYLYWKERIEALQKRGGVLSIRQWSGKPYEKGSHTETILEVPASIVEVQQLVMTRTRSDEPEYVEVQPGLYEPRTGYDYEATVEGEPYDVEFIAKNDGLTLEDFKAWFNPVFDEYEKNLALMSDDGEVIPPSETRLTFAVIHFTTFRY